MRKNLPFLMIVHQARSVTGRLGRKLQARGYPLDIRRPMQGEVLPENLDRHAGVAIFGGPMSANDDHLDGLKGELRFIERILGAQKPVLGICLGAQMIARVMGATVRPHAEGCAEIGYYPIEPTQADPDFLGDHRWFYQWHREGFDIPEGAQVLATGHLFENQAFRVNGKIYGLQFHPEVTTDMMMRWLSVAAHRLSMPGACPAQSHRQNNVRFDADVDRWLDHFIDQRLLKDSNGS